MGLVGRVVEAAKAAYSSFSSGRSLDSAKVKKAEEVLLRELRKHAPQGRGVDLPPAATSDPAKQYLAVAAQNLVDRTNGEITIQRFQDRLTLVRRTVMDRQIAESAASAPWAAHEAVLQRAGFYARPGDDPFVAYDPEGVMTGKSRSDAEWEADATANEKKVEELRAWAKEHAS